MQPDDRLRSLKPARLYGPDHHRPKQRKPWSHSALPLRAYNQIYNAWFRDENLQNSVAKNVGDGPDSTGDYVLLKRGKRKDYFTGALPWPQKGNAAVTLPRNYCTSQCRSLNRYRE